MFVNKYRSDQVRRVPIILRSSSLVAAFAPYDPMSLRPPCMLVSTDSVPHQHTKLWSCLLNNAVPVPTCSRLCSAASSVMLCQALPAQSCVSAN